MEDIKKESETLENEKGNIWKANFTERDGRLDTEEPNVSETDDTATLFIM